MHADLHGGITQRLELRDLLALEPNQPREHRAAHERGNAEEDRGKGERQAVQHLQLIIEPHGRRVSRDARRQCARRRRRGCDRAPPIGAGSCPGARSTSTLLNAALQIERRGEFALIHPEDAEAPVVRKRLARARFENKLRRERDAHDVQPLRAPRIVTSISFAGLKPCASANASPTTTSLWLPISGSRPRADEEQIELLARSSGSESIIPSAGSASPGRSSVMRPVTRVSTAATRGFPRAARARHSARA